LLKIFAVEYIDHACLESSIAGIFQHLLRSEGQKDELTCDDMMQGLSKLEALDEHDDTGTTRSRLHMTKMDYATITENGALANTRGALGAAEFDIVMRKQVSYYIKRKLQRAVSESEELQDFASLASMKALVMEVGELRHAQMKMQSEMLSSFADLHAAIALQQTDNNRGGPGMDNHSFIQEMKQSVKSLQQGHTAAESERKNSRRDMLKVASSPTELRAENADSFSLGRTMSALTSWGEHIAVYDEERQESEKQGIEDYELQAAVSHSGVGKRDSGERGCMTSVPEVACDVDAELFLIKKMRHAPRADCMKSGQIASLDEEMMEVVLDETVATLANGDQDEATEDEDSEYKSGDAFASLGKEMRRVLLRW
jgi:hypothetical protein